MWTCWKTIFPTNIVRANIWHVYSIVFFRLYCVCDIDMHVYMKKNTYDIHALLMPYFMKELNSAIQAFCIKLQEFKIVNAKF